MSRGRVAVVFPGLDAGGTQLVMLALAGGFARRNCDVDVVVANSDGPLRDRVPPGVRLVDLGTGGVIATVRALARYIRRERPAAMLSALDSMNVLALLARRAARIPLRMVVSVRSDMGGSAANIPTLRNRAVFALARLLYPAADAIVAVSAGVGRSVAARTGVGPSKIHVIYNPVVSDDFDRRAAEPLQHRFFGIAPVIVSVGRLTAAKDYETLLRAFARVRSRRDARLIIVGEGEERPRLESLIASLALSDDVDLAGFAENPLPYISAASLFVMSSRWEGLPNALIQALACGARIVSTDCPSGPAEILEDGRWGTLVPVGDVDALAAAIEENLGREAPQGQSDAAAARFHEESIVSRYLDVVMGGV